MADLLIYTFATNSRRHLRGRDPDAARVGRAAHPRALCTRRRAGRQEGCGRVARGRRDLAGGGGPRVDARGHAEARAGRRGRPAVFDYWEIEAGTKGCPGLAGRLHNSSCMRNLQMVGLEVGVFEGLFVRRLGDILAQVGGLDFLHAQVCCGKQHEGQANS